MIAVASLPQAAHHARFVKMLPQIQRYASFYFRKETRADREDLVAEVVGMSYLSFASLVERDRLEFAFPSTLARYACKLTRAGRRVGNRSDIRDLMSRRARKKGIFIHGLFEQDERGRWEELIVEDKKTRPADVATCRVDFRAWLATLPLRNRRIAEALAAGSTTSEVAERFGVSSGRVSQLRRELDSLWQEFHGELVEEAA